MRHRERRIQDDGGHERRRHGPEAPPSADGDLRSAAERLLAVGDDAIGRALSGDSAAFLAANRQEGGQ